MIHDVEKIIEIKEFNEDRQRYAGYLIKTNKQEIKLIMDCFQRCCENSGYLLSHDNTDEFIGAELKNITLTDTALNTKKMGVTT